MSRHCSLVCCGLLAAAGPAAGQSATWAAAGGANGAGVEQFPGQLDGTTSSTLELGTGSHRLKFLAFGTGGFGGAGANLPVGSVLTVTGWQGEAYSGGAAGDIVFTDSGGLNSTTLARIQFEGFPAGAALIPYTGLGGGLELVPVPEPAAALALAAVGLGAVRPARRRILA